MIRICFVCLGNICRSPTAESVMRQVVRDAGLQEQVEIDSAGTGAWHVGERPDPRAQQVGKRRGVPVSGRARQFKAADFKRFDYIIAMDASNRNDLQALVGTEEDRAKIHLLRDFDPAGKPNLDVPDPYYGGDQGFDRVFDICTAACTGLLQALRRRHGF